MCAKCDMVMGSFVDGYVLDSYFFSLTQVAYISISVCCTSDFENENGAKIENGIGSQGNRSRSGLGRIYPYHVKQEAQTEPKLLISLGFATV